MNWLGKALGLPEEFLNCSPGPGGGIIQVNMRTNLVRLSDSLEDSAPSRV
jgi:hypothetical protein